MTLGAVPPGLVIWGSGGTAVWCACSLPSVVILQHASAPPSIRVFARLGGILSTTTIVFLTVLSCGVLGFYALITGLLAKGFAQQHAQIIKQRRIRALAQKVRTTPVPSGDRRQAGSSEWHDAVTGTTRMLQNRRGQ